MKKIYTSTTALTLGALFGFCLSKGRASDFDTIQNMFLLRDFQLYGVIAVAAGLVMLTLFLVQKFKLKTISGQPIKIVGKVFNKGTVYGSIIFGVGWALTGGCPGTFLVMLGAGKLLALATIVGIMLGAYLEARWVES